MGVRKVKVLLVGPPALTRLIQHLFREGPGFEIVGSLMGARHLAREAARLRPALIVANVKPVSTGVGAAAVFIKRCSPRSKLILICPVGDLTGRALNSGADACLKQENLVSRLVPAAVALSARARTAVRS
jgi:hypothetical protein